MKKYMVLSLSIMLLILGNAAARAWGGTGPYPTPYAPQAYQTTIAPYRLTPQQVPYVRQAFKEMRYSFQQNHTICKTRGECLRLDLASLVNFVNTNSYHPAVPLFRNIYNLINNDCLKQKFTSQWVVFQNLSQQRQSEFKKGLRIMPLRPQTVRKAWGVTWITAPATFNQDDVFTILLEEIDHHHKNCEGYLACLSADLRIINGVRNRLSRADPVRTSLSMLREIVKIKANQTIFNTNLYLTLYNPLDPDWYDATKKHKAKHLAGSGYTQWQQAGANARQARWYSARVTNGTPVTMTPAQTVIFVPAPYPVAPGNPGQDNFFRQWLNSARQYIKKW